jgi:SPP1 family phage portal protein
VLPEIDAYDKAQSNTANDRDYFTDAYLIIKGAGGGFTDDEGNEIPQSEAEKNLRNSRVMFFDDNGDAKFLVKQADGSQDEAYKDRIFRDIFFISQVPAMTDESFSGDLSGIAIRYKLIGLEQLAIMKENKFRLAVQKKIKLVTDWINLKHSTSYDPAMVQQIYERNFIDNDTEKIENAAKAEGMVSKETQLSMLPSSVVPDTQKELARIQEEKSKEEFGYGEEELLEDEA